MSGTIGGGGDRSHGCGVYGSVLETAAGGWMAKGGDLGFVEAPGKGGGLGFCIGIRVGIIKGVAGDVGVGGADDGVG